jgi:hypothetical protein
MNRLLVTCGALAACGTPSLELALELPDDPALRPQGMTTVTLEARLETTTISTTAPIDFDDSGRGYFDLGNLELEGSGEFSVELRSATERLVGFGQAAQEVAASDGDNRVIIPVRRPFVYTASGSGMFTFDLSLDVSDDVYQGKLGSDEVITVHPLGTLLLVIVGPAGSPQLVILDSADHQLQPRAAIGLPSGSRDLVAVRGTSTVVVAHAQGLAVVDLERDQVVDVPLGVAVDRLVVSGTGAGATVYGLVERVVPVEAQVPCTGSSRLVRFDVTTGNSEVLLPARAISDLGATRDLEWIAAVDPCQGKLLAVHPDLAIDELADVTRPARLAMTRDRIWMVGSTLRDRSIPLSTPAQLIISSVLPDGSDLQQLELAPKREAMQSRNDPEREVSNTMGASFVRPLDLGILPGGDRVVVITDNRFDTEALVDADGSSVLIPAMDAITSEVLVIDTRTGSQARVRARCELTVIDAIAAAFPDWDCAETAEIERPRQESFAPRALTTLPGSP